MWDLIMMANYSLYTNGYTPARQAERAYQEALKKVLDESNNNFNFVQSAPCYMQAAPTMRSAEKMIVQESRNIVWPNPSAGVFNLRITDIIDSKVEINVTDITGRRVLSFKGTTNRDLQFGEKLNPGIYFVEIWRDGQKNIERIIKQ
ncbi:MAG: T9SS type A sorting domain-containing protein [Bacteroidota bacterium]